MTGSDRSIVLIGGGGMLGRAWRDLLDARGIPHAAPARPDADLTHPASLDAAIPAETTHVVNCAAWTDVDAAETQEPDATRVNGSGVAALAARAAAVGATLVNYSTDYVFNGQASTPYPTDHPRDPLNAYGRSKAAGEAALEQAAGLSWLNLRTSWLYAPWGRNFVLTMARLTADKPQLRVVDDQRGRPTSCDHLAASSLALLDRLDAGHLAPGHYHVTDGGDCTWHELTRAIADHLGHTACDIQPCATADFPRPAPRPPYSVLDLTTTEQALGPMPHWRTNLANTLDRMTGSDST